MLFIYFFCYRLRFGYDFRSMLPIVCFRFDLWKKLFLIWSLLLLQLIFAFSDPKIIFPILIILITLFPNPSNSLWNSHTRNTSFWSTSPNSLNVGIANFSLIWITRWIAFMLFSTTVQYRANYREKDHCIHHIWRIRVLF